jgi:hypothetical protein
VAAAGTAGGQVPLCVFVAPDDLPGTTLVGTIDGLGITKTSLKMFSAVKPSTIF